MKHKDRMDQLRTFSKIFLRLSLTYFVVAPFWIGAFITYPCKTGTKLSSAMAHLVLFMMFIDKNSTRFAFWPSFAILREYHQVCGGGEIGRHTSLRC